MVHGFAGLMGLGLLIWALDEPRHGDAMGVGSFGTTAALMFTVALALGILVPRVGRRWPKAAGGVLAVHATIAITAFVLFLAWASTG